MAHCEYGGYLKWPTLAYAYAMSSYDWQRLIDYIRKEMSHRGWNQTDLAKESGVPRRTLTRLMSGAHEYARPPDAIYRIEEAFGWKTGTARAILEGRDPEEEEEVPLRAIVDELMDHYDRMVAASHGRHRRELEAKRPIVASRLRLRNGE